jgi:ABC-type sugar transport system permease subunit
VTYLYDAGFQYYESGYAAAMSWVLFVLILALSMIQLRLFRYSEVD